MGAERETLRLKHGLQLKDEELRPRTEGRQDQAGGRRACTGLDDVDGTEEAHLREAGPQEPASLRGPGRGQLWKPAQALTLSRMVSVRIKSGHHGSQASWQQRHWEMAIWEKREMVAEGASARLSALPDSSPRPSLR